MKDFCYHDFFILFVTMPIYYFISYLFFFIKMAILPSHD